MFEEMKEQAQTRVIKAALLKSIKDKKAAASNMTPVNRGILKLALHFSRTYNAATGSVEGSLGYRTRGKRSAPHAHLVEWGTKDRYVPIYRRTLLGGKKKIGERFVGRVKAQRNMTRAYKVTGGARPVVKVFKHELAKAIVRAHRKHKNKRWYTCFT